MENIKWERRRDQTRTEKVGIRFQLDQANIAITFKGVRIRTYRQLQANHRHPDSASFWQEKAYVPLWSVHSRSKQNIRTAGGINSRTNLLQYQGWASLWTPRQYRWSALHRRRPWVGQPCDWRTELVLQDCQENIRLQHKGERLKESQLPTPRDLLGLRIARDSVQ